VSACAGLAHDAGNLLGALGLYCDLLERPGVLRLEHRHYVTELRKLSDSSGALLLRLLEGFAPFSSVPAVPSPAALSNPATVLREIAPMLERIAAPLSRVTLSLPRTGLGNAPQLTDVPSEVIERITVNLVRNAAQAIEQANRPRKEPGLIAITLLVQGDRLRLSIEDNGPGMPPAVAAAFLRPTPLPAGAARGFGHRIIHELAAATGGTLSIRVRPGRGTTFTLKWPLPPSGVTPDPSVVPSPVVPSLPSGLAVHSSSPLGDISC
jgi:signal transduction histidine kinase